MQTVAKSQGSPVDIARAIADRHAEAVEFPAMMFADDAPVGLVAQRMADGRYDKAFLISEVERFTGVKVDIPEKPGKILAVIPQHGYWSSELTLTDQVFRAAGYDVDYVTPRGAAALRVRREHGHHVPRPGMERRPGVAG
jgi:hypothetical protein